MRIKVPLIELIRHIQIIRMSASMGSLLGQPCHGAIIHEENNEMRSQWGSTMYIIMFIGGSQQVPQGTQCAPSRAVLLLAI